MTSSITRLVLAIKSLETDETLERWQFDVQTDEAAIAALAAAEEAKAAGKPAPKSAGGSSSGGWSLGRKWEEEGEDGEGGTGGD